MRSLAVAVGFLFLPGPALSAPAAAEPPPREAAATGIRLGKPFLQLVRRYGAPTRVQPVRLFGTEPGVEEQKAVMWVYERRTGDVLEFVLDARGVLVQSTHRSPELKKYRVVPD